MNTSFPSATLRAVKTAAVDAAKRASITRTDAEEAHFQDLLSDRKAHEAAAGADGGVSEEQTRLAATRRGADESPSTSAPTDRANTPPQPLEAISVHQAMLAPPARLESELKTMPTGEPGGPVAPDVNSTRPAGETSFAAAASPIEPHGPPVAPDDGPTPPAGVKLPLIEPHGPPVPIDEGGDDAMPTGGIKAPHDDPSVPPAVETDGDPTPAAGGKPPLINPHGPPPVVTDERAADAAITSVAQGKLLVVNPHGPVETGLSVAESKQPVAARPDGPTSGISLGSALSPSASAISASELVVTPARSSSGQTVMLADRTAPAALPAPVNGLARGEYTTTIPARGEYSTTIPVRQDQPTDARPANPFLVTTAAQAQFVAIQASAPLANSVGVELMDLSASGAANLAARIGQAPVSAVGLKIQDVSQPVDSEDIAVDISRGGTAVAKRQGNVMTYPSTLRSATERAAWSTPDADVFSAPDWSDDGSSDSLRGRAKEGDAARASVATAPAANAPASVAQTPFTAAVSAAPSSGIVQVDKMETLLQTVQQTAERVRFDGTGQVELRVRLEGVAEEVAVRVHLDENKQTQVSFQTNSPELRAALERGWSDLTANTGAATGFSPANTTDLRSSQLAGDPATVEAYRDDRTALAATISTTPEQAKRWSGYA